MYNSGEWIKNISELYLEAPLVKSLEVWLLLFSFDPLSTKKKSEKS